MYHSHIRDNDRKVVQVGDSVKILCDGKKEFTRKVGKVILVDPANHRIFDQMRKNGSGIWWNPRWTRLHPWFPKRCLKWFMRSFRIDERPTLTAHIDAAIWAAVIIAVVAGSIVFILTSKGAI